MFSISFCIASVKVQFYLSDGSSIVDAGGQKSDPALTVVDLSGSRLQRSRHDRATNPSKTSVATTYGPVAVFSPSYAAPRSHADTRVIRDAR